ncbi:MAG: insulinase family protein [Candidatus Pacearchaeota archaeon]|nr:MAG: insulinase family protein [Candidatus Pacearchaeota archaeon]
MVEFYKIKQKSGLTILFEKRDLPIVAIMAAARTGAAYETIRNKGIAHFFEHMVFKGPTKKRTTKEISSAIEKAGGILNAFTAEQVTNFWTKIPSKHFELGTDVIFDILENPAFTPKELERERGVVLSEIDRYHDLPEEYLFDKIKEFLYAKPFGTSILGLKETVSKLKRSDLLNWHKYYDPKNMIICIVGSANLKEIDNMAKKYFGKNKGIKIPEARIKLLMKNKEVIERRQGLDQTHFALGFHRPSLSNKMRYASEVFNAILGEGMSSVLFQEVREKRGWAYLIHSYLQREKDYGYCTVYAGVEKKNIKKVKEIILKEIKGMAKAKARDLDEAKEQKIGNWQLSLESCNNTATNLIFQEMATKAEDFYDYPEKIYDVKLQDIKKLAKIKNYCNMVLVPD